MSIAPWFWFGAAALILWGVVGLFQKLCTNHISGESALICAVVGWLFLLLWVHPQKSFWSYSPNGIAMGVACGVTNALGAWMLLSAMRGGGKASIVVPLTALYPLLLVISTPFLLHESLSVRQLLGIGSSIAAVILLSMEDPIRD